MSLKFFRQRGGDAGDVVDADDAAPVQCEDILDSALLIVVDFPRPAYAVAYFCVVRQAVGSETTRIGGVDFDQDDFPLQVVDVLMGDGAFRQKKGQGTSSI